LEPDFEPDLEPGWEPENRARKKGNADPVKLESGRTGLHGPDLDGPDLGGPDLNEVDLDEPEPG
jgi:hypothetical protein